MSFIDWIKQTASNVGTFVRDKVIRPTSSAIDWINEKVVQPGANALKNLPVIGQVAQAVGQAGNAASNIGQMAAGKRRFDVGEALGNVNEVQEGGRAVYDAIKKRR